MKPLMLPMDLPEAPEGFSLHSLELTANGVLMLAEQAGRLVSPSRGSRELWMRVFLRPVGRFWAVGEYSQGQPLEGHDSYPTLEAAVEGAAQVLRQADAVERLGAKGTERRFRRYINENE